MDAVEAAGGGRASRWKQAWYERCGGFRALLVEQVAPVSEERPYESSYVEW